MKILLTGASGNFGKEFIGQSQHEIIPLNRDDWSGLEQKLTNVDVVVHAASDLHTKTAIAPVTSLNSNVISTAKLLEAMSKASVKKLIFMSSCAVYGESMRTEEKSSCQPTSINGVGKLLNEMVIADFCRSNTIEFKILRVFNMYGGDDNFSILSHIRHALENKTPFVLNNLGIAQRDFIHVSDVVALVGQILELDFPFTHLNIGTGKTTRISTLVEITQKRHPGLLLKHSRRDEAEYSRADIRRLTSLTDKQFISIREYLMNEFKIAKK